MTRLWDRGEPLDIEILRYTAGDDHALDERLVSYDIRASIAHARMLSACGYLTAGDLQLMEKALGDLGAEHEAGGWTIALEEEDCHTALENRLTERIGAAGRRIHLGRSRNDQVLAALRLWLIDELEVLAARGEALAAALKQLGDRQASVPIPGYTHMQRAMPSSVGLWAGGFAAEISDDVLGLRDARRRALKNPLGSAAGYGVPVLDLDRARTTEELSFASIHEPVTAVQLSRGKAEATALFEAHLLAQDISRLASDLVLFATAEFAFVKLPDAMTTGSSMLPQKRNPDVFELARGRAAESAAALIEVLSITAKMTSGYHRDFQLIKKPLFRSFDAVGATCRVMTHAVNEIRFDPARTAAAMDSDLFMAERAYRLVKERGMPFRDAYLLAREAE